MELLLKVSIKRFDETKPGELVQLQLGSKSIFGIVLLYDNNKCIGNLDKPNNLEQEVVSRRTIIVPYSNANIKSYGLNWVVMPRNISDAKLGEPLNTDLYSGLLCIFNQKTFITFNTADNYALENTLTFDTDTWSSIDNPNFYDGITLKNWDIWATKDDFEREPDKPLIQMQA